MHHAQYSTSTALYLLTARILKGMALSYKRHWTDTFGGIKSCAPISPPRWNTHCPSVRLCRKPPFLSICLFIVLLLLARPTFSLFIQTLWHVPATDRSGPASRPSVTAPRSRAAGPLFSAFIIRSRIGAVNKKPRDQNTACVIVNAVCCT